MKNLLENYEKIEKYFCMCRGLTDNDFFSLYTNYNILSSYIINYLTCRYKKYNLKIFYDDTKSIYSFFTNLVITDSMAKTIKSDTIRILKNERWNLNNDPDTYIYKPTNIEFFIDDNV